MNGSWWSGTRLVAARVLAEGARSRTWRIVMAVLLVLGIAAVVVPRLIGEQEPSYTLATVGPTPAPIAAQLDASAAAGGFAVEYESVPDAASAEAAVRDRRADVALAGEGGEAVLYVAADRGGSFPALVSQAVVNVSTTSAMVEAGLAPEQIADILSTPPPEQVQVGRVADEGRAGVGFVVGIVLYLALIFTGSNIATAVATEKSARISEVLLAVLRPTQLLVGTVLGVGALGLAQIAVLAVPVGFGLRDTEALQLPSSTTGDIALGVAWFLLGLLVYAFVFGALGALVEKVTEVSAAMLPVNIVLIGSYLLAIVVTANDPDSWASVVASFFPLSAPLVMPVRWASGLVPGWQLALAMFATALGAVVLALVASRIYSRGLARSGQRVRLLDALRS